jgi:single-strand selective monofunctional uracil DNA glycosylase
LELNTITDDLATALQPLKFSAPVSHVYNPLDYAKAPYSEYLRRYGRPPREVVLIGMNPGPWGMSQTGVPFGEVAMVREWLGIERPVGRPAEMHPKRPVTGFDCPRSEVSGRRIWGWARKRYGSPRNFFSRYFIANYCPLQFIEESGRNRTPNQLRAAERKALFEVCDTALRRTIAALKPRFVIGVGQFTMDRAQKSLDGMAVTIGKITHPSPANPKANRGWEATIEKELTALGIEL